MKKMLFFFALTLAGLSCANAQSLKTKDVPSVVQTAFAAKFSNATEVDWVLEEGKYEAGFEANEQEISALFDAQGNLLETETEIAVSALPAPVAAAVTQMYPGKKIKEAAQITDAAGKVTYEAEVQGKDLIFDAYGNFLK